MGDAETNDEELMLRVQNGDERSYEVLFERHSRAVHGLLRRSGEPPERAAELFQDTWLKVYRGRATYQPGQRFRSWLFGIALNTRRDAARRAGRTIHEAEEDVNLPTLRGNPDLKLTLDAAIQSLPETLREAFLLGVVYGFDHNELAGQLGVSPDNARARVSRARAALRVKLGGEA